MEIHLPPHSTCPSCGAEITLAREAPLARRAWELLRPLEPDADTINVERHLPAKFQLAPPKFDGGLFAPGYGNALNAADQRPPARERPRVDSSASADRARLVSPLSPQSSGLPQPPFSFHAEVFSPDDQAEQGKRGQDYTPLQAHAQDHAQDTAYLHLDPNLPADPSGSSQFRGSHSHSGADLSPIMSPTESTALSSSRTAPLINTPPEKGKSKWRLKFAGTRKPSIGTSADSSSLSSTALEAQKLEEIPLGSLCSVSKSAARGKSSKNVHVELSKSSSLALFWTQLSIHVWDVGVSPPIMTRSIPTESTCILATVAKLHLAYVIGTRDQKLTVLNSLLSSPPPPSS